MYKIMSTENTNCKSCLRVIPAGKICYIGNLDPDSDDIYCSTWCAGVRK